MFTDLSIDDFIYYEYSSETGQSFDYLKPNTDPPNISSYDIRLYGSSSYTCLDFISPYIDNTTGLLGEIIGKIRTLDGFYKMCGYNFTNDEIVKMAIPVPRLSKYVYNHIILFNEGGRYKYSDENHMEWDEGTKHLKYIHTIAPNNIIMGYEEKFDIIPNCQRIEIYLAYSQPVGVDEFECLLYELSYVYIKAEKILNICPESANRLWYCRLSLHGCHFWFISSNNVGKKTESRIIIIVPCII